MCIMFSIVLRCSTRIVRSQPKVRKIVFYIFSTVALKQCLNSGYIEFYMYVK